MQRGEGFVGVVKTSKKNIGSNFDDFLSENAMLDETTAVAVKRFIAWQIEQEQNLNKTAMASAAVLEIKLKVELHAA